MVTVSEQSKKREFTDRELAHLHLRGRSITALATLVDSSFSTVKARLQRSGVRLSRYGRGRRRAAHLILLESQAARVSRADHLYDVYQTQACPSCGAAAGQWCVTRKGRRPATLHAARFQAMLGFEEATR